MRVRARLSIGCLRSMWRGYPGSVHVDLMPGPGRQQSLLLALLVWIAVGLS